MLKGTTAAGSASTGWVIGRAYGAYATNADLATAIPGDDSIPQVGEGTQILSVAITPQATANRVRVRFRGFAASAVTADQVCAALFRNGGANAIAACWATTPLLNYMTTLAFEFEDSPGSVSAQTYTIRVGGNGTTVRLNGTSAARFGGGVSGATLILEEIKG